MSTAKAMPLSNKREASKNTPKDRVFLWEGKDKSGKICRGEARASGEASVKTLLRRQGIIATKIKARSGGSIGKISDKDLALLTRQMATMMRAGVPLLQSFDIVSKGTSNVAVSRLLTEIRTDVETGTALHHAFRKHPNYFDPLFCNLVAAGEQAGILDSLLDRLAIYKEKMLAIKGKIKSALTYPVAILVVAFIIVAVIMLFVVPAFKQVFESFGAELPAPTQVIIAMSDGFVAYWYLIFGSIFAAGYFFKQSYRRSEALRASCDRALLRSPVFGNIVRKSVLARWTRTLSTMFAAGVPLVEALDSVAGAAGSIEYVHATREIQSDVSSGTSLTAAMQESGVFPNIVLQMVSIGEESGALDSMLGKIADIYEREVDEAVESMSALMEPMIMVILGVLIGGMVVAMYLPIFKLGQVV